MLAQQSAVGIQARELGTFWLRRGQVYVLHTRFSTDGRALDPTDPHLKIEVQTDFYEETMFKACSSCAGASGLWRSAF
jgi:hypothetical protein